MTANGFSDGLAGFMQWQNQYLEQMKNLFPGTPTQQQPSNPWSAMFDGFNRNANEPQVATYPFSQGSQNPIAMMMQMTKSFMDSMESSLAAAQQNGEQWQSAVNQSLNDMQAHFGNLPGSAFTPMMNFSGPGNDPWAAWKNLFNPAAAHTSMNPWAGMMPASGGSSLPGFSGNWPTMPGLGPDREKFEKLQRLQSLGVSYMTALFKFNEQYRDFWPHIIERLKSRIEDSVQSGDDSAATARALYNLWVDAAEEEYAALTRQDSYQQSYGEMINAMMELRQASTALQDDMLKAINIPTLRELDSLSERLQRTRRENRALRTELQALRTEMTAVSQAVATQARPTAMPTRKTTPRKKATPARTKAATQSTAATKPE